MPTGNILTAQGWRFGRLDIAHGRIAGIKGDPVDPRANDAPFIIPGFIDLHVHGGGGADVMEGVQALTTMARLHARYGTSALLATTMTAPRGQLEAVLAALGQAAGERPPGAARMLGIHLEGPYINRAKLGAQPDAALTAALDEVLHYLALAPIKVVTLAPELTGHLAIIAALAARGVRVQVGHTLGTYENGVEALAHGACGFTHLFNAMSGLHHREPGMVGAALAHAEYAELIPDLLHVHPGAIRAALRSIPRLYCVTDGTAASGMPDGDYRLGSQAVTKCIGGVRLADGTLAGSALTMDQALRNLVSMGLPLAEASHRLSRFPAAYLGVDDRGTLAVGAWADVLVLDRQLHLREIHIEGEPIAPAAPARPAAAAATSHAPGEARRASDEAMHEASDEAMRTASGEAIRAASNEAMHTASNEAMRTASNEAPVSPPSDAAYQTPYAVQGGRSETKADLAPDEAGGAWRAVLVLTQTGGLHARPAAAACKAVRGFKSRVEMVYGDRRAALASVTGLLALGVPENASVEIVGTGEDAPQAVAAAVAALGSDLGDLLDDAGAPPPQVPPALPAHTATSCSLSGLAASPGIAIGRLLRFDEDDVELPEQGGANAGAESRRLDQALATVDMQLLEAVRSASQRGAMGEAGIFAAHRMLLEDPALIDTARDWISLGKSVPYAWRASIRASAALLLKVGTPLMAERASDLIDLEKRVLRALGAIHSVRPALQPDTVLAARELTPSDLSDLSEGDVARIVGIVMAQGGVSSHAAIIARQLGIPVLVGLGEKLLDIPDGARVVVDANRACLDYAPTDRDVERARSEHRGDAVAHERALRASHNAAATLDGQVIDVAANLATVEDARRALVNGADSVGLLRTELLFLHRRQAPTADEHRRSYQAVVDALDGRPASIRTLDVGADKEVEYLTVPPASNPALGLRGVRLTSLHAELFDDQLRGLLGVEPAGIVRILLPMITDAVELIALRKRIESVARSLGRTGPLEIGVMIEVPSAALLADQLARHADFLSIGTNDLTQYALAMDRNDTTFATRADGLHPAVLRLIDSAVRGGREHGRRVNVCGTMAADLEAIPILLGLGATELSVDPLAIPSVKTRIRELDYRVCRQHVPEALGFDSAEAVRAMSRARWPAGGAAGGPTGGEAGGPAGAA